MTTIVRVEYRASILLIREEILRSLGNPVVSVSDSLSARNLDLSVVEVGVIVIGHGAPLQERCDLIAHFKDIQPKIPLVALLRQRDDPFESPIG